MFGLKLLTSAVLIVSAEAFSRQPSAFTGRVVCDKAELTTGLSCPPSASTLGRRGNTMSMPPFLKKLGLKKPEKPIFGEEENQDTSVAILDKPEIDESKAVVIDEECVVEEEMSETQKLMQKVKESGTAGKKNLIFFCLSRQLLYYLVIISYL